MRYVHTLWRLAERTAMGKEMKEWHQVDDRTNIINKQINKNNQNKTSIGQSMNTDGKTNTW